MPYEYTGLWTSPVKRQNKGLLGVSKGDGLNSRRLWTFLILKKRPCTKKKERKRGRKKGRKEKTQGNLALGLQFSNLCRNTHLKLIYLSINLFVYFPHGISLFHSMTMARFGVPVKVKVVDPDRRGMCLGVLYCQGPLLGTYKVTCTDVWSSERNCCMIPSRD